MKKLFQVSQKAIQKPLPMLQLRKFVPREFTMDFKSLYYVLAVADKRTISGAAKDLGISQPSLSKYLQNLQDTLEVRLFERQEGKLIPTDAGNRYLEAGKKILNASKELFSGQMEKYQGLSTKHSTIDLRHLYYVVAVAKEQNISHAADKLFIAQSALSQIIIKLEERIGTSLFNRQKYGLSLTPEGERFIRTAEKILDIKKERDEDMRLITSRHAGKIRFGISHTFSNSLLPQVLSDFHQDYPSAEIIVQTETSSVLQHMLLDASLDAAVIVELGERELRLDYEVLFYEQIVLAVSRDNPISQKGIRKGKDEYPYLEPALLCGQNFVLSEGNMRLRQSADIFFAAEGINPIVAVTTADIDTAKNLATHNVGIAFIPISHIIEDQTPKKLCCFSTAASLADWTISVVRTKKSKLFPLMDAFLSALKANV
jgi:DNA-binding transcriptional LysR family regulator